MRTTLSVILVLSAMLTVPAAPLAAAPAGHVDTEPVCVPACTVPSATFAYAPPLTIVESGATVTYTSVDFLGHTATDEGSWCMHVSYATGRDGSVTFIIRDGALWAETALYGERECTSAEALPDGSFLLEVTCVHHPMMVHHVLVRPRAGDA